jgi:hypothetical protein
MRLVRLMVALAIILVVAAAPVAASPGFNATLQLQFVSVDVDFPPDQPPVVHLTFAGQGTIAGVGRVSVLTQVAEVQVEGCKPSVAVHTLTSATGTLELTSNDEVCLRPHAGWLGTKINGNWTVSGATGSFAGAQGWGTASGVITGPGASVKLVGNVELP